MPQWLKQLLCNHIWKIDKQEENGFQIRYTFGGRNPETRDVFQCYIITEKCVKCNEERIREEEVLFEQYVFGVKQ